MNELEKKVHISHCCKKHGCKYGDSDCPVVTLESAQKYPCEECEYDPIETTLKIQWKKQAPTEEGQYLCKFHGCNSVELCTVYYRPESYFGGAKFGGYLAIAEWGAKAVNRGYNCLWSEKIEA